jgi:predicted XRE-type DNA-binding protein
MSKGYNSAIRVGVTTRRAAFDPEELSDVEAALYERWLYRVDDARKQVAEQIVDSVRAKWGTAVALEAATGICQTEISRIRRGKFDRFSLERLVRLLCIVDPDVEVQIQVKVISKDERS